MSANNGQSTAFWCVKGVQSSCQTENIPHFAVRVLRVGKREEEEEENVVRGDVDVHR